MPEFSFTILEHDPDRPSQVVGQAIRRTVRLDADEHFFVWARERWPEPRWSIELDPYQL
jgi:hypothetical protein